MKFIWIRHGETDWNVKRCYLGHLDVPLNQNGKLQARQTAELLKNKYVPHEDVTLHQHQVQHQVKHQVLRHKEHQVYLPIQIYSSDLSRCMETAKILCDELFVNDNLFFENNNLFDNLINEGKQMDKKKFGSRYHSLIIPCSDLRELNFGDWDGKTYDDIYSVDPDRLETWYADPFTVAPPNGETLAQLGARVDSFLEDLMNHADPDATILLVSHGGTIRWFQSRWILQDSSQFWQVKQIPNGGILVADWDQASRAWKSDT